MLKHKLIELTTCFDRQISEMCLFNKVLHQVRRPLQFTYESSETFHQCSKPTQFTDASFETFHQGCKPTQFTDASFETFHQGSKLTQFFNIGDNVNTSAAAADYDPRAERHELATQEETRQIEQRHEQIAEGIRQEALAALNHAGQSRIQGQTQDRAVAEAAVNQVRSEAQGVINEALGAVHRERQERSQMAKAEQNAKQIIKEEENKRRNEQREEPVTPRAKAKAKSGPSPKKAIAKESTAPEEIRTSTTIPRWGSNSQWKHI